MQAYFNKPTSILGTNELFENLASGYKPFNGPLNRLSDPEMLNRRYLIKLNDPSIKI